MSLSLAQSDALPHCDSRNVGRLPDRPSEAESTVSGFSASTVGACGVFPGPPNNPAKTPRPRVLLIATIGLGYVISGSPMPWRCPACQTQIEHGPGGDLPRLGVIYRCHVCRLELVFDEGLGRLMAAPFPAEHNRRATDKQAS